MCKEAAYIYVWLSNVCVNKRESNRQNSYLKVLWLKREVLKKDRVLKLVI